MSSLEDLNSGTLEAALIANAGEAFIVADADGVIRFWNAAAERMFGYSREQALGEPLDLIVPDKLRRAHWDGYRRVMETGQTKYVGPDAVGARDAVRRRTHLRVVHSVPAPRRRRIANRYRRDHA